MVNKLKIKGNTKKIGKTNGEKYAEYLKVLMVKNNNKLTPEQILADARRKESVLHDYFEWDNTEAARKYRIQQARELMQMVVEVRFIENRPVEVRKFVSVKKGTKDQHYVTMDTALKNKSYRYELISNIINHLKNTQTLLELLQQQK